MNVIKFKKFIKENYTNTKEEVIGEISTDTAQLFITGSSDDLSDDNKKEVEIGNYQSGNHGNIVATTSTGSDGNYKIIARWNDFINGKGGNNIPDEIVIKLKNSHSR